MSDEKYKKEKKILKNEQLRIASVDYLIRNSEVKMLPAGQV